MTAVAREIRGKSQPRRGLRRCPEPLAMKPWIRMRSGHSCKLAAPLLDGNNGGRPLAGANAFYVQKDAAQSRHHPWIVAIEHVLEGQAKQAVLYRTGFAVLALDSVEDAEELGSRISGRGHGFDRGNWTSYLSLNANVRQRASQDMPVYLGLSGTRCRRQMDRLGNLEDLCCRHDILATGDAAEGIDQRRLLAWLRIAVILVKCFQNLVKGSFHVPLYVQALHAYFPKIPVPTDQPEGCGCIVQGAERLLTADPMYRAIGMDDKPKPLVECSSPLRLVAPVARAYPEAPANPRRPAKALSGQHAFAGWMRPWWIPRYGPNGATVLPSEGVGRHGARRRRSRLTESRFNSTDRPTVACRPRHGRHRLIFLESAPHDDPTGQRPR